MSIAHHTILLIDDTPPIRFFMRLTLEEEGARCIEASNLQEGLESTKQHKPDMIVLDMDLPDDTLFERMQQLKSADHSPNIIMLTTRREKCFINKATSCGADATVNKPFAISDLLDAIETINNKKINTQQGQ